jgi:hypothetical protein
MRITTAILAAFALSACSPREEAKTAPTQDVSAATSAPSERAEFAAAGGNVGCTFTPAGGTDVYTTVDGRAELFCDRVDPAYVRLSMSEVGPAREVRTGERGCCSGVVLATGAHWVQGPFACDVSESGVVCSSADGHGFTLTRTQAEVR